MAMSNKEEAAAAKKRGNAHYAKQEWEAAIEEYTKAIGLYGEDHSYYSNRSACYAATDKFEEALADGQKCVSLKPDWAKGYGRVGYALFKLDKLEKAKEVYEKGLKIDGNNSTLKDGLAQCEQAMNKPKGQGLFGPQIWQTISLDPELRPFMNDQEFVQKVNMLNANPQMAMQMGVLNDPKIKKVFEKLMGMSFGAGGPGGDNDNKTNDNKTNDNESGGHIHSDKCAHGTHDTNPYNNENKNNNNNNNQKEEEKKTKEPTPEPEPELTEEEKKEKEEKEKIQSEALKYKTEGNKLYKDKKFKEAIIEYKKAQKLDYKKASYVLNESAALFMLSEWDECILCCERAIRVSQEYFDDLKWCFKAYNRMGCVEEKRNNLLVAIEYYKKALVEKHDDKLRKHIKKLELRDIKQKKEALYDPILGEKLKKEGNELFQQGKFAEAIEKYSDAISRNPSDHKIYSNRATAYCKLMTWNAAMKDCDSAIKLEPLFIKAYIRKGKIHHCLKEYHRALEAYKQAEQIDSSVEDLIRAKRETLMAIQKRNQSGAISEEERARALQDPQVQKAMNDPEVSSVLLQAQSGDATILYKAMRDRPHIKDKIELLMAAGVLRLG